jgi:hypothetical protein
MKYKQYDLSIGTRISKLVFTGEYKSENGRRLTLWNCDCGKDKWIRTDKVIGKNGVIKSCGCESPTKNWSKHIEKYGENYPYWIIFERLKKGAEARGKAWSLTVEDIIIKYKEQDGKCFYTGEKFILPTSFTSKHNTSIDRIDSNLGYHLNNIKLVTKDINFCKHTLSHSEFIDICKKIASRF